MQNEIIDAAKRIQPYIRKTPLEHSIALSKLTNANVYLKYETIQHTGAFKVRGAFNKLLSLSASEQQRGIVTASSGNHGAAVALGLTKFNIPGIIFLPKNASPTKIENIQKYDVPIEYYGEDCVETEMHAIHTAEQNKKLYISPYNDLQIIAGQGTVAVELIDQLDKIDAVFVPVGGGGLISGIAAYLKAMTKNIQIIGCQPKNSAAMAASIKAGHIVETVNKPTLSDATAGGIEPGSITFDFCQQWVDDYFLVSEAAIKKAIILLIETQHLLVEGAAAVALASFLAHAQSFQGQNVVIVLSGGNISLPTLKSVLDSENNKDFNARL